MRCTTCGNEAPDGAAHCPSCGAALATGSAPGWGSSEQGSGDQGSGQTGTTPGGWSSPPSTPTPPPAWGSQEQASPPPAWGGQESAGWSQQGPSDPPPSYPPPGANPGFASPGGYGSAGGFASAGGYGTPPPAWDGGAAIGSQTGTLAGWWYRVGAFVIDGIILAVVDGILRAIGGVGLEYGGGIVFGIVYFGVLFSRYGASVGMMALGTRCVRERDGSFLPFWPAVGRYLLSLVLELTGIGFILDALWPLWDAKNQTIHDKAVGTLVVRSR